MYTKDWIAKWALYSPEKLALKELDTGRTLTYAELNDCANHLATVLTQHPGLRPGDRVMVIAEFSLEYVALFVAAQKAGFILVPVNYRLTAGEIDYLVDNCQPRLLIYEEQFAEKTRQLRALPAIPQVWPLREISRHCQRARLRGVNPRFESAPLAEDAPLFILYTSGTTGFPKGALYTHKMLLWNSLNTTLALSLTADDSTIVCTPPFHTGGWNVLLTPLLHRGGTVGFVKKFQPDRLLELLARERTAIFMAVPTMLKMMMDSPAFASADLSAIRYFIVGGEALPLPVIQAWHRRGVPIRQGFGLTEVGPNLFSLHQDDAERKIGSIGRANFYVDYRLLDEAGREVAPGAVGELCLHGPTVMPGYWNDPAATATALNNGWFRTGDLLRQDADGYLYVMDRLKNMYISGGENVYPAEIERFLLTFPGVVEAAVIGVPDEKWGEVGKAFIVSNGVGVSPAAMLEYCGANLARFKVPRCVELVAELPKSDTGKINKNQLRTHR